MQTPIRSARWRMVRYAKLCRVSAMPIKTAIGRAQLGSLKCFIRKNTPSVIHAFNKKMTSEWLGGTTKTIIPAEKSEIRETNK